MRMLSEEARTGPVCSVWTKCGITLGYSKRGHLWVLRGKWAECIDGKAYCYERDGGEAYGDSMGDARKALMKGV